MSVALVTGAAGIVGPGICAELKSSGWTVVAADRSAESFAQLEARGTRLEADASLSADLSRSDEVAGLIAAAQRLGPIALVVNNATAHNRPIPLAQLDAATCEKIWRVDLLAPLLLVQAATADLAANQGLVINLSSVRVQHVTAGHLPYITAKAATEAMTEVMALELAPQNIRVNCLRLGAVPGDGFLRAALELLPPELGQRLRAEILPGHFEQAGRSSSLGNSYGTPHDIGRAIVFLASAAGKFINGATIPVDGGFVLRQHQRASEAATGPNTVHQWLSDPRGQVRAWLKSRNIDFAV